MKPDTSTSPQICDDHDTEVSDMPTKTPTEVSNVSTDMPTETPTKTPTKTPTESGQMSTKTPTQKPKKTPCDEQILQCLATGPKRFRDIYAGVNTSSESYIRKIVKELRDSGKILKIERSQYILNADLIERVEEQNTWTVNVLLNLYDREMAKVLTTPNVNFEELQAIMDTLYRCAMVVERGLKRWYLVNRGYDTNTRQAQEDAKQKTVEREKIEMENTPPEDQVVVVQEYDESMRVVLAKLPGKDLKKRTV